MNSALVQLGAAVVIIYFVTKIIQEVLRFAKSAKQVGAQNGNSGTQPISFWQQEFRKAIRDELQSLFLQRDARLAEMIRKIVREEIGRGE